MAIRIAALTSVKPGASISSAAAEPIRLVMTPASPVFRKTAKQEMLFSCSICSRRKTEGVGGCAFCTHPISGGGRSEITAPILRWKGVFVF